MHGQNHIGNNSSVVSFTNKTDSVRTTQQWMRVRVTIVAMEKN